MRILFDICGDLDVWFQWFCRDIVSPDCWVTGVTVCAICFCPIHNNNPYIYIVGSVARRLDMCITQTPYDIETICESFNWFLTIHTHCDSKEWILLHSIYVCISVVQSGVASVVLCQSVNFTYINIYIRLGETCWPNLHNRQRCNKLPTCQKHIHIYITHHLLQSTIKCKGN